MNPYTQQTNQANPYSYNQNFISNLPPELVNSFANQPNNNNGTSNTNSPQQSMFDQQQQQMANMMAKRQVYANNSMFNMPSHSSMESSPVMSLQSPQIQQSSMMTPQQQLFQLQQQQQLRSSQQQPWMNKQPQQQLALQRMDDQQKRQFLMLQQQQMKKAQQLQRQTAFNATNNIETEESTETKKAPFSPNETEMNSKRVEIILAMNQELIRLFIENKNAGRNLEPDSLVYQARLQSNLTFLATMADISMVKPGEEFKMPPPPDLSSLPPPKSDIGKRIHETLNNAANLFERYPTPDDQIESQLQRKSSESSSHQMSSSTLTLQQQMLQQQALRQQQFNMNRMGSMNSPITSTPPTSTPVINTMVRNTNSMMDPQSILRQAQQAQNMMQQQQIMANMGLNVSSPSNNPNLLNGFSPVQQNTESPSMTSIPQQMTPTDLLAANGMINPNSMLINPNNNLMLNGNNGIYTPENTEDYSNVMLMMQRLPQ